MSSFRVAIFLLIGLALLTPLQAGAAVFVSVEANPSIIPADGKSHSQVLVTILDSNGAPVSDGTEVRLTTSAGDITAAVYTSGGRAVGILTSAQCPQIAVINAIANGGSASAQVEFSSSAGYEEATASARAIRMEGGSLAYCVDKDTVLASSGVTIEYMGLTIKANAAQVSQKSGRILAQGDVTVSKGDTSVRADALICNTQNDTIRLLGTDDKSGDKTYDIALEPVGSKETDGDPGFVPLSDVDGKTWIVSSRLVLIPRDKILFFKASIYVGRAEILKVPYYSYSYEKRESILQQVRYTSDDGMLVDLPLYYQMSDSATGALKLRYAADGSDTGGYTRPRKGLSLGLDQDYSMGESGQGRVFIDSVGNSSQALEVSHHLEFGSLLTGGRADISTRYQPSSTYAKNIYYTTLNVAGSMSRYNYSLTGYFGGSSVREYVDNCLEYVGQSNCTVKAVFSPAAFKSSGRPSPSYALGYGTLWTESDEATSSCLYQSFGLRYNRAESGDGRFRTGFEAITALTMTADADMGASLRAGPTLRRIWNGGNASIGYTLNAMSGTTESISTQGVHQLICSLFLSGGKWNSNSSAGYGLDSRRLSLISNLNLRPSKNWRARCSYNLYSYAYSLNDIGYRYINSYLKVGLYHPLGPYEIGIAWSPDGQNYGIDKDKRFWLELGGKS
ncbi:MAG: invasin domain 3-containing protein [Armatimonadota bacterium]